MFHKIYNCFTSQTFRTQSENTRMRQEIEIKKEAIRKNLEDINLFNQAMSDLPGNQLEGAGLTISLDHSRKEVTWHKDTRSKRQSSLTSVTSDPSIV